MPPEGICKQAHADILRFEEMLVVARAAVSCGVEQIRITGGEPLVRKGVVGFIEELSRLEGLKDLCLTTNASRLSEMAVALKEAGLNRVNVSLDSLDSANFTKLTRTGQLKPVLQGIEAAIEVGLLPVKINVVLVPGLNDHEIEDFAEFARQNDVTLRFIERMPFDAAEKAADFVSEEQVFSRLSKRYNLIEVQEAETFGPARTYAIENGKGRIGFVSPRTRPFCQSCKRLRLTANGFLLPCLDSDLGVQMRNKTQSEIEKVIVDLYAQKASWQKNQACFGSTFDSSLSKIGG
jgi:cyclic pyranopterin phosphate synthase